MDEPMHFEEPTYICNVEAGSKLITVGARVMLVRPNRPPAWVTPMGLVPLNVVDKLT